MDRGKHLLTQFNFPGIAPEVLESDNYEDTYSGENVLREEKEGEGNYWLADNIKEKPSLTLDLHQYKYVTGFRIKNTKNGEKKDRGTKEFTIFGDGQTLTSDTLNDITKVDGEAELEHFSVDPPKLVRIIKFQIDSFYGDGGGLQYFSVEGATSKLLLVNPIYLLTHYSFHK